MQILDFNAIQQPEWPIKLKDEAQTVVTLTAPTQKLVERLVALSADLKGIREEGDERHISKVFELIVDVMNNNLDGLKFSGESLRDKYRMNFYDAILFVRQYLVFINEISEAKN